MQYPLRPLRSYVRVVGIKAASTPDAELPFPQTRSSLGAYRASSSASSYFYPFVQAKIPSLTVAF